MFTFVVVVVVVYNSVSSIFLLVVFKIYLKEMKKLFMKSYLFLFILICALLIFNFILVELYFFKERKNRI